MTTPTVTTSISPSNYGPRLIGWMKGWTPEQRTWIFRTFRASDGTKLQGRDIRPYLFGIYSEVVRVTGNDSLGLFPVEDEPDSEQLELDLTPRILPPLALVSKLAQAQEELAVA